MPDQPQKPRLQTTLASVESDLLGAILAFHKKVMTLVRGASLDDEKITVVAARIKTLLDEAAAEVKQTQQLNIKKRLETAYEEVKRLVDELSA